MISQKSKVKSQKYISKIKNFLGVSFIIFFVISFSVFGFSFFVFPAHAAVGINKQINFQGKLVDANGLNVADSTYTVVFTLYNVSSGGSAIWTETDSVTTTAGIFQVALGATTPLPDTLYFNNDSLYLGIKVNTDAEMTPRIRFSAVPYAFNAGSLNGVIATQSATGFTMAGGTSSTSTLSVTTSGGALTFQPGVAEGLTVESNGASGLTLDTGGSGAITIGNNNATSFVFGKTANNPTFSFNNGTAGFTIGGSGTLTLAALNTADGLVYTQSTNGQLSQTAPTAGSQCLQSNSGNTGLTWISCSSAGTNYWQLNNGTISPFSNTADLLLGGTNSTATSSAGFHVYGSLASGTMPVASISANTSYAALVVNNSGKGDLFTASSSGLSRFVITQNGAVGIGTRMPQATYLDVGENPAAAFVPTTDFVDIGNSTGQEPTVDGINALQLSWFVKPASGNMSSAQRINITNNNTATAGQAQGLRILATGAGGAIASDTVGLFIDGLTNASKGTTNQNAIEVGANWDSSIFGDGDLRINANGNIIMATSSASTKIGINTTAPLATLDVRGNSGTIPVASVSGKTSFAGLVINNSGVGDLFTASSGGLTRFRMTNNGSVVFQGDSLTSIGSGGTNTTSGAVENHIGDTGSLVPNPGFDSAVTGIGFADGWAVAATNSAAVTRDTTVMAKGVASAKVTFSGASQSTAIYSTCIPLALQSGTGSYTLNYYAKPSVATRVVVRAYIDAYTSKGNCQTNTTPTFSSPQGGSLGSTNWTTTGSGATAITFASGTNTWGRVHIFVGCPASCSGTTTVNIDGVRLIQSANNIGLDYAENYPADPNDIPQAGDVVSIEASTSGVFVSRTAKFMDQSVIGVVSTNPGDVLDDGRMQYPVPVALAGRVPVNVSTENGPIHIGDYLTSSTIPGVAVKATGAGPVIGTAMEDDTDPDTVHSTEITMFIKNTYYNGGSADNTGLILTSGAQDSSILLSMLGSGVATDSALTALSSGQAQAGFNILISAVRNQRESTASAVLGIASSSALVSSGNIAALDGLTVTNSATVSGDLRVKGNALIEGILHIADTLFANNFIASGISEFFGNVIFHTDVTFNGRPTVNNDTAGFALIKKGADHVDVNFKKPFEQTPVVNVSITIDSSASGQEQNILANQMYYFVTKRSTQGFTIRLAKLASDDITFSWFALGVQNPILFQSNTQENESPTPTELPGITPLPEFTASQSASP